MNERWQMNRMGFVNFWLYDDEVFTFEKGHLFIRGTNGSGKSITTQSFIPFILDGDKRPERLDPFGSRDRQMVYYLLGNNEKEDETGYLYLEFKKGEDYRTIGIGQRARRGKDMDFWGFVIQDNTRIGIDLQLYRTQGEAQIPLSRQQLKNALGDNNPVVEKQKEYMALVNRYIFDFPRLELYDQFIQLMIKIRAPKLSRDFTPSKVYQILGDSLQTLSDEDLEVMSAAMESLEGMQLQLEGLREAKRAVSRINRTYDGYNRYMLARKAAAYYAAREEAREKTKTLEALIAKLELAKKTLAEGEAQVKVLAEELEALSREKETLGSADLDSAVEKREHEKQKLVEISREIKRLEAKITEEQAKIREAEDDKYDCQQTMKVCGDQLEGVLSEYAELNEALGFDPLPRASELLMESKEKHPLEGVKQSLRDYASGIAEGIQALKSLRQAAEAESEQAKRTDAQEKRAKASARLLEGAEKTREDCRDALIEAYYQHKGQVFILEPEKRKEIGSGLMTYKGSGDWGPLRAILESLRDQYSDELSMQDARLTSEKSQLEKKCEEAEAALAAAKAQKLAVPEQSTPRATARKLLKEQGIEAEPLYALIDFAPQLSQEAQSLLEEQLTDLGLLDALVVAEADRKGAEALLKDGADTFLVPLSSETGTPDARFVPEVCSPALGEALKKLLQVFTDGVLGSTAQVVLSPDGYYRHGILKGHSLPKAAPCFVGKQARLRHQQAQIAAAEKQVKHLRERLAACEAAWAEAREKRQRLEAEYSHLPGPAALDKAIEGVQTARVEMTHQQGVYEQEAARLAVLEEAQKQAYQKMLRVCQSYPYARSVAAYEEAETQAQTGLELLDSLWELTEEHRNARQAARYLQEKIEIFENNSEEFSSRHALQEEARRQGEKLVKALEAFLNRPDIKARSERLTTLVQCIAEKNKARSAIEIKGAATKNEIKNLKESGEAVEKSFQAAKEKAMKLRGYYEEELTLDFVEETREEGETKQLEAARACCSGTDMEKSEGDMLKALNERLRQYGGSLTDYGITLEDCFESDPTALRKRQCILGRFNGIQLSLPALETVLDEQIGVHEVLIGKEDQRIFKEIMTDTLSQKLSNQIQESRLFIGDMSTLMKNIDTSMGLSFSLEWKPKKTEDSRILGTKELEKLLMRDQALLPFEETQKIGTHFRTKIEAARQAAEEGEQVVNYQDLVREALDYRQWFEFRLFIHREGEPKQELTNSAFNRFSGGEKAMAMYVPLFAAVNAQYKKANKAAHPRIIALDEAFAGVDEKNIESMFALVDALDFDYIMNSQALWGCYETVKALHIAELLRPAGSSTVTVMHYIWNGKEKCLG